MNVVLVKPKSENVHPSVKTVRMPLNLAYLAGACRHEHEVTIVDSEIIEGGIDNVIRTISALKPDVVGITATTPLVPSAHAISEGVHRLLPNVKTIIGGPHATALPEMTLQRTGFDYVCAGEGEEVLPALLRCLAEEREPEGIPGLMYKKGSIIRGSASPVVTYRLDTLQLPARDILDLSRYNDPPRGINEPQDIIFTARGCVGKCAFCLSADSKVRLRSLDSIFAEMDQIVFRFGIKFLIIGDDTFTLNKKRTIEFCRRLIEGNYNIRYICQTRMDKVDAELLEWLERSGCYAICFGIESGNERILKSMRKNIDLQMLRKNIPLVKSFSFNIRATYIIGWIDETEREILNTILLAEDVDADENAFCIATPFPGTELWHEAVRRGMSVQFGDMHKFHFYFDVGFNMSKVSDDRLLKLQKIAHEQVPSRMYKVQ